ncbi:EAL domain-containing protein [Marinomonas profundimaris]|uniref:Diguanylate cyclase n=1 Tax=Marinomonas profundimaris TaxID=1208321 RepID=W1S248_9GAMM|nr:EAL domain-containing protein [Marinomonas profundimaris]ETI62089.1 diguanylate cyclase [Marinomonas profundimaris]
MMFRRVFFVLLTLLVYSQSAFSLVVAETTLGELPTFKETASTSPHDILLNAEFKQSLYRESQDFATPAYWHKLVFPKAISPSSAPSLVLGMNYYVIEHLDFYLFHGDQLHAHWTRGALQDWQGDTDHYDGIWIPITLSNDASTTLLIRKQGNSPLLTPFKLLSNQEAANQKENKLLFWVFVISSLLILLTHNFFVFILLRQPGFVYYLCLNVVVLVALSVITGFSRWIFSETISQWIIQNLFTIFGLGTWILYRFSVQFLKEVNIPSPHSLIYKYGDAVFILFLILTQLIPVKASASLFAAIEAFLLITCSYWGIQAYKKGFIAVRFYLFSWFVLMAGSILNTFIFWKILPINLFTESIFPISSLLQLLGFAFAFADKANHIEHKRQLQALTDIATGLPNRTYYFDRLPEEINQIGKNHPKLALIMIELTSHLKISQAFGPAKADSALCEVILNIHQEAIKMDGILPLPLPNKKQKKLIRFTAKNIVLISTTPDLIKQQIQHIQKTLDQPTIVDKVLFRHQYKIGSALYPSQGGNLDKLYQNVLIASNSVTYSSGHWAPFTSKLKSNHAHQLRLITLLTDDIRQEKLYFEIQPQIHLADNRIVGGEILIRWHNEHLGQVSPAEFIPLAEQTGLIYKLTDMLLEKVFQWSSSNPSALTAQTLSINISALDLVQEDFSERVENLLHRHNLPANKFTIEITETSIFQNSAIVDHNVKKLHSAGFKLAIDDFGVGYSSMQNLVSLATDELKIDQFFVMNLIADSQSQTLCRSMINLSKELNIISVAEGIESEEVLKLLQAWQCQVGQGYHLHRPMSPAKYLMLLEEKDQPLSPPTNRA